MFLSNFCEINRLNNFCLGNKGMDFRPNITPMEVIKKGTFARTYFRNIYSGVNGKWYKKHGQNLMSWKILIKSIIAQIIMMSVLINMVSSVEHH